MTETPTLEELEAAVKAAQDVLMADSDAEMNANWKIEISCNKWNSLKADLDVIDKETDELKRKRDEVVHERNVKRAKFNEAKKAVLLHPTKLAERRRDAPRRIKVIYDAWKDEGKAEDVARASGLSTGTVGDMLGAYLELRGLDIFLQEPYGWRNDACVFVLSTEDLRVQLRVEHSWESQKNSAGEWYMSVAKSDLAIIIQGVVVFEAVWTVDTDEHGREDKVDLECYRYFDDRENVPSDLVGWVPPTSGLISDGMYARFLRLLISAFPFDCLRVSPGKGILAKLRAADVPYGSMRAVHVVPNHPKPKPSFNALEDYGIEATE